MEIKLYKYHYEQYIKYAIGNKYDWAIRGLIYLYGLQDGNEKFGHFSNKKNKQGFNKYDALELSKLAEQYEKCGFLTDDQMKSVYFKLPKYWNQFLVVSDPIKLEHQTREYFNQIGIQLTLKF